MTLAEELADAKEQIAFYKGLVARQVEDVPRQWGLSKFEARVASCIIAKGRASLDDIVLWTYSDVADEPDYAVTSTRVRVCCIRKKARRCGVELVCDHGFGYRFDPPVPRLKGAPQG